VRERADTPSRAMGQRSYAIAAVRDATGEMAAMTEFFVAPDDPRWGHQGLTAVTRPHRGHRLGLLLKTTMLEWLAEAEPGIERIDTGNAAANDHMIAVNDALGFELVHLSVGSPGLPAGLRAPRWVASDSPCAGWRLGRAGAGQGTTGGWP
jgi:RimJ/RimL family protein N-acetyltransferase